MSPPVQPTPAPNVELELAKLANEAMQNGADPHDATSKLHDMISYLRAFPKMAEHATNALADGVASPADITRALYPHAQGYATAQRSSVQPTTEEAASLPADKLGVGGTIAANVANTAQGIPGVEAAQAGVRSVVRRQPYREAYGDIESATKQIPSALRVGERIAGAAPLAAVLPGSAAVSGALIGGADEALSANPDESLGTRASKTAVGTVAGGVAGKALDVGTSGVRSLFAQNSAKNLLAKQAARAASAQKLYAAALQEGHNNPMTPEIQQFLKEPDIAEIVGELKQTRPFANVAEDAPEMLDAVYKTLSDRAGVVKKGLQSLTPNRPNIGRFAGQDIKAAQGQALDAMSGTPGYSPMPSYAKAVEDFAQRSREIEAVQRGHEAFRSSLSDNLPTAKNLTRKTPEAFAEWAKTATPEEIQAARQGIQGGAKMSMRLSPNPLKSFGIVPSIARAGKSADLLRMAPSDPQTYFDALQNLGLLTAGNQITTP